jgi:beta-galactosidase
VTVSSGALPGGRRAWFVFNWSGEETPLPLDRPVIDAVAGARHPGGTELSLAAWSVLTLIDE